MMMFVRNWEENSRMFTFEPLGGSSWVIRHSYLLSRYSFVVLGMKSL